MRPAVALLAVFMVVGASVAMKVGGRNLATVEHSGRAEPDSPAATELAAAPRLEGEPTPDPSPADVSQPQGPDRSSKGALERIERREPLSELSLALPPKLPSGPSGVILFRPIATSSARFEAMDRVVAVAGVENVELDERCSYEGKDWDCGIHARTAFRAFIRGRAITCDLAPDAPKEVVADCHIGAQDVGEWLVANGWARASPGGPYTDAEKKARDARLGVFGPPPKPSSALR
ncbi:MAG TPA: thermonuclease family protein [Rhizobiaceae bacterium]|nr:thermonuclease family protein [Rhizobiaceae bacterium]